MFQEMFPGNELKEQLFSDKGEHWRSDQDIGSRENT